MGETQALFAAELRRLHVSAGKPSYSTLARRSGVPKATVGELLTGRFVHAPPWDKVRAVVQACVEESPRNERGQIPREVATRGALEWWRRRHGELIEALDTAQRPREKGVGIVAGKAIRSLTNPVEFEVHPAIVVPGSSDLPVVPAYVRREHDDQADDFLRQISGHNQMLVFVGGSSTGKTRAAWEAVHRLPDDWALWHPIEPTRPEAVLTGLKAGVPPKTVLWLNELQRYLGPPEADLGERVAAALRDLMRNEQSGPVLVVGTLWPDHWSALTGSDKSEQAHYLLDQATLIQVPETFNRAVIARLLSERTDPRLLLALRNGNGRVTQFLAGVRELVERYRHATPVQHALLAMAADASRMANLTRMPERWLIDAAEDYLTDHDWSLVGDARWADCAQRALAELALPRKGTAGPLRRTRDREPLYELADYLTESIITQRRYEVPPSSFWETAERVIDDPAILTTIANSAMNRALYRHAKSLYRAAIAYEYVPAIQALAELLKRTGSVTEMTELYLQAIDQGHTWAVQALAKVAAGCVQSGDHAGAERVWLMLVDRGHGPAWVELMTSRERLGDKPGADRYAEAMLSDPASAEFIHRVVDIALTRMRSGDSAGAERLFRLCAAVGDIGAAAELTSLQMRAGDTDGAQRTINGSSNPSEASLLAMGATLREELRARQKPVTDKPVPRAAAIPAEEVESFERGRTIAQAREVARLATAAESGNLTALRQLLLLNPDDHAVRDRLVSLLRSAEQNGDVYATVEIATLLPNDPDRINLLVDSYREHLAVQTMQQLAESQEKAGNLTTAIELYRLVVDGGGPRGLAGLTRCLERLGRLRDAHAVRTRGFDV